MTDCNECAQALPIAACPTTIAMGMLGEDAPLIVVRFTDFATGRVTIAKADEATGKYIVAFTPFDFAPGHAVKVEVFDTTSFAPVEFFPYVVKPDGAMTVSASPVTCIVFTPIKSFNDGSLYPPGPRTLKIEA